MSMYLRHLVGLLSHKLRVFKWCVRLGIPWLGIIHDVSKFHPLEFVKYARRFYGDGCPEWHLGWLHHQNSNKHHTEYWVIRGSYKTGPVDMPDRYIKEMVADLMAMSEKYHTPNYYLENQKRVTEKTNRRILELLSNLSYE